jgi:hypothetical protein
MAGIANERIRFLISYFRCMNSAMMKNALARVPITNTPFRKCLGRKFVS